MQTITLPPPTQRQSPWPAPFLVQPANLLIDRDFVCESACSLLATRIDGSGHLLIGLTCKRWGCRPCAQAKIKRLSWQTKFAAPNRLITLTVDPFLRDDQGNQIGNRYESPRAAFEQTAKFVPETIRQLRKRFGPIEYLRVTELHKSGYPHYHLLVRSDYLPHAVLKAIWQGYTGAPIVHLKAVAKNFGAYVYLTKYLTKMHSLAWTERHVSYSKDFFPPECRNTTPAPALGDYRKLDDHPYSYLARHCMGLTITQLSPLTFKLEPSSTTTPSTF